MAEVSGAVAATKSAPLEAVLFDLDGTLVDTALDFVRIIKQMCAERGLSAPSDDVVRQVVSAGSAHMVGLFAKDSEAAQAKNEFLQRYQDQICVDSKLYEGGDQLLEWLDAHQLPWGVVTNKPRHLATELLAALGLTERCKALVCPEDVAKSKPDPEGLFQACALLGVTPAHALYVGDHSRDVQAGLAAGMTTCAALYGYLNHKEAHELMGLADFSVQSLAELLPWLRIRQNKANLA